MPFLGEDVHEADEPIAGGLAEAVDGESAPSPPHVRGQVLR